MTNVWPVALNRCLPAHLAHRRLDRRTLKLDHLAALFAVQVLVLRIAVIVFVERPRSDLQPAQQARVDELGERAIDRRPADADAGLFHVVDELLGVEMVVLAEDVMDHVALLAGEALRPRTAGEVLAELVFRTLRHGDGWQLHGAIPLRAGGPLHWFTEITLSRMILDCYGGNGCKIAAACGLWPNDPAKPQACNHSLRPVTADRRGYRGPPPICRAYRRRRRRFRGARAAPDPYECRYERTTGRPRRAARATIVSVSVAPESDQIHMTRALETGPAKQVGP